MNTRFAQWTAPALAFFTLIAAACWWDPPPRDGPHHTPTAIVLTNTPAPTNTPKPTATATPISSPTAGPIGLAIEDVKATVTEAIAQLTSEQVQAITEEAAAMMCEVAGSVYAPTLTLEDFTEDRLALRDIKSFCVLR